MIMDMATKESSLISRSEGTMLREKLIEYIKSGEDIELDFSKIERITQSFADELFGKIQYDISFELFKEKVKIKNASEDIQKMIKYAIFQRLNKF